MEKLKKNLLSKESSKIKDIVWNSISCGLMAGQMAIMLLFLARWDDLELVGVVTIGYAFASLAVTVGRFGIRNYQVTDNANDKSFNDYLYCQFITTLIAILAFLVFVIVKVKLGTYSSYKGIIIFEIIVLRCIDAIEGCYFGQYQKEGKFATGAIISSIHQFVVLFVLCVLIVLNLDIKLIFLIAVISSLVSLYLPLAVESKRNHIIDRKRKTDASNIKKILVDCLPLCIGTSLAIYAGNIPKYAIDMYLDESTQAIFGYIMLPVFVVTLLNQFIYQPFVKGLGDLWAVNDRKGFLRSVLRQCAVVLGLAIIVLVVCLIIGLPLLSVLYKVDLMVYKSEFIILLIGGSFYAIAYYLTIPITAMRKQNFVAIGYFVVSALAFGFQKMATVNYGVVGAAWLYVLINAILVVLYFFITIFYVKSLGREKL